MIIPDTSDKKEKGAKAPLPLNLVRGQNFARLLRPMRFLPRIQLYF